ncbi:erg26, C-3 sterol dehydrogenase [Xylographa bjoerkii]|nr:erg26, C-3 sterol dehydrogenase [Xylographa bjoerkii]
MPATILHYLQSRKDAYRQTKALADALVLAANGTSLKTFSLRPSSVFGKGDVQVFPGILAAIADYQTRYQIGNNTNCSDFVYVENVADMHVIAARALLTNAPGVAGEAFFITNDAPMPSWTFVRKVWAVAGHVSSEEKIIAVTLWMALVGVIVAEWAFDIGKAKERLGYVPKVGIDEGIRRAVDWRIRKKETGPSASLKSEEGELTKG